MTQRQKNYQNKKLNTITESILSLFQDVSFEDYEDWAEIPMVYPENMKTGNRYKATNLIYLNAVMQQKGYEKPFFGTARQIFKLDGSIIKGEKGYPGVRTQPVYKWKKKRVAREELKAIYDARFQRDYKSFRDFTINCPEATAYRFLKFFTLFNVKQTTLDEKYPFDPETNRTTYKHNREAIDHKFDTLINRLKTEKSLNLFVRPSNKAYYNFKKDYIILPEKQQFKQKERFMSTGFHELTHWTGHHSRLDRNMNGFVKNSKSYAFEELIAELSSFFLCHEFGISKFVKRSSAYYLKTWSSHFENTAVFKEVIPEANRAQDYIKD